MRRMQKRSIKESGGLHKGRSINPSTHLGKLMYKYRDVDEVLYPYVSSADLVYDDMDFTVEEFADMTGASVNDLIDELTKVCK